MKRLVDQQPPDRTCSNLEYTNGLNAALRRRESVINLLLGIDAGGNQIAPATKTLARLILPDDKDYTGDPFAKPYAGDYSLAVVDIDMPKPRHQRQLTSFVQRLRLGLPPTAEEDYRSAKTQDFYVNDEGMLFAGGGLRLLLYPDVKVGYIPVRHEDGDPMAPTAAVVAPEPTPPPLEVFAEPLRSQ